MVYIKKNEKSARFDTRLSEEQKEMFERAARLGGYRSLTDFVVLTVQSKAEEIIQEHEKILASEEDRRVFFKAITQKPWPVEKLKQAQEELQNKNES